MKNAGLYVRVSTERQVQEGYSVAAQKNNLTKFAKDNNFNIYSIYSDEGISGKNVKDRPEVRRLIKDIELGSIDVVLIYKFDRLTRNISDTEDFINLINKYRITIYTLSEGNVDVSNPQGRFVTRLKGAVAQLEREQTAERIKVAFVQKVKDGYSLCCNTCSYGYNRKNGQKIMSINQEEARVVKRIFRMYLDNYSFTDIAKSLNLEHVPTKKYGCEVKIRDSNGDIVSSKVIKSVWQPKTIRLILSNPTYIGKVRYGINTKEYFEAKGLHEAIISQKMWDEVQQKLSRIKHGSHTKLPKDDVYYCGTLVCGICGKRMTTSRTIGRLRKDGKHNLFNAYRCVNREKQLCTASGVSHSKVERAFLKYLKNIECFDTTELVIQNEIYELKEEILSIQKIIQNIRNKLKEVMSMFMANAIDHSQFTYMSNELKKNIELNEEKLKKIQSNYHPYILNKNDVAKSILEHWQFLTDREKKAFINKFIDEIVIINRRIDRKHNEAEVLSVKFYEDFPSFCKY